jgi:hypothetical protein
MNGAKNSPLFFARFAQLRAMRGAEAITVERRRLIGLSCPADSDRTNTIAPTSTCAHGCILFVRQTVPR